jgi:hypothetical protein
MSRSNNIDLQNPAVRFFDWSAKAAGAPITEDNPTGLQGRLEYFDKSLGDKEKGEKGKNVAVKLPFRFMVLDRVVQITGGIDVGDSYENYWSNAVKNIKTQTLIVKSKRGTVAQGLYNEIKGITGVHFMTGLYIAFKEGDDYQIGYLKLKGCALTEWIEFAPRNIYEGAFGIVDTVAKKKGSNHFFAPVFKTYPEVSKEADAKAKELDRELQVYLSAYFALTQEPNQNMPEQYHESSNDFEPESNDTIDQERAKQVAANQMLYGRDEPDEDTLDNRVMDQVEEVSIKGTPTGGYDDDIPF